MPTLSRVLIVLSVMGIPGAVMAQPANEEVAQRPPGWVFTPSVGLGGTWDNNILLTGEGDPAFKDYGTPVNSGLRLDYRGRRLSFGGSYDGSFVMYRTYEELNSTDQQMSVRLDHQATSRVKVFAQEYYHQAPSTDALNMTGVPFLRTGSRTNEAGGGLEALVARHTRLETRYVIRSVTFEEHPGQQLNDGHEHQWTVSLARAQSTRLNVGVSYDLRHEVLSNPEDRFNIQQAGVTAEYTLTPAITVSGLLGLSYWRRA